MRLIETVRKSYFAVPGIVAASLLLALCAGAAAADILPLDGAWISLDQTMSSGDFFSGSWQWSSGRTVEFQITDIDVISDQFQIYDLGSLVATTPSVPQWQDLISIGVIDPFQSPPLTDDPTEAFNSGFYSTGDLFFLPGFHSITISDIAIPLDPSGVPFPDGTIAFRAFETPEPSTARLVGFLILLPGAARCYLTCRQRKVQEWLQSCDNGF